MKERIRILIIGKGGKESVLAWKLLQSPRLDRLWSAPGVTAGCEKAFGVDTEDFDSIVDFIVRNSIDLVIVADAKLIVKGLSDYLREKCDVKVIGPGKDAARLEGSKEYAKEFMFENSIPSARFMSVTKETYEEGVAFLEYMNPPYVLKADGLAEGKGVLIIDSLAEATEILYEMISGLFGNSSHTVLIEEFLRGEECTVTLAVDGENYLMLPVVRDYKRKFDGNEGPNTAGMGAVTPVADVTPEFLEKVENRIIRPTLRGLHNEGIDYSGFLYLGIINVDGEPMIFEYNVRLGDPETEAMLPLIKSDFVEILEGLADRTLPLKKLTVSDESCVAIVATTSEYPKKANVSHPVNIPENTEDTLFFEADVETSPEGVLFTGGGRVAVVCGIGCDREEARRKAMDGIEKIEFEGKYFRNDIGTL